MGGNSWLQAHLGSSPPAPRLFLLTLRYGTLFAYIVPLSVVPYPGPEATKPGDPQKDMMSQGNPSLELFFKSFLWVTNQTVTHTKEYLLGRKAALAKPSKNGNCGFNQFPLEEDRDVMIYPSFRFILQIRGENIHSHSSRLRKNKLQNLACRH